MPIDPEIRKVLVVLDAEVSRPDAPKSSVLMRRAAELANATGCELELFHICYRSSLDHGLFTSDEKLETLRQQVTDRSATQLAELAAWLASEGITASHEARWDAPRTDAMLRKIADSGADVIMKTAREHSYLLGITSNTDWELARRSPAHVWLVNQSTAEIGRIVAAVGNRFAAVKDDAQRADRELLETATKLGKALDADVRAINAYAAAPTMTAIAGPVGAAAVPTAETLEEQREQADKSVEQHRTALVSLAGQYGLPDEKVHLYKGDPADVIPNAADILHADAIVMGAGSIGRMERFLTPVTVEPVMSKASCDIVILREHDDKAAVAAAKREPIKGETPYDLGKAITFPEDTFESPEEVANMDDISVALRKRILQAWEYDLRAEMREENEGGAVRDADTAALDAVIVAKELLRTKEQRATSRQAS